MKIIAMEVGYIATNCYIVVNEETHHGVIIDPGGDAGRIMEAVQKENLTVDAIFLTHGHGDHIMALAEVAEKTGAPVYISKEDAPMLTDPVGSLAAYIGGERLKKQPISFMPTAMKWKQPALSLKCWQHRGILPAAYAF